MANETHHIIKIGLVVTDQNTMLLVRKRGGTSYILPGGKPEQGEEDYQTLVREINEELGCGLEPDSVIFLGEFSDSAADLVNTIVTVRLYGARLIGKPMPRSEIESLAWIKPSEAPVIQIAPSIQNHIMPFLCRQGLSEIA